MKKIIAVIITGLFLVACQKNMATPDYSPRMTNTNEHQQAIGVSDCLGCHKVNEIKDHSDKDNCFLCHNICPGCIK